jgi:RNA 3'-terminal phosphate cyclase (ATP)
MNTVALSARACRCGAVHVDGGQGLGSGTIVRHAAALSALTGTRIHVVNARAKRPVPGLRPQHVAAVRACAEMCGGVAEGLEVGSREFRISPGPRLSGGARAWDIGSAGSTTMLALSVLPLGAFAPDGLIARITGGVFQDFAPSPFHLAHVTLPALASMGLHASLSLIRAGYPPSGAGTIELRVRPLGSALRPFEASNRGDAGLVEGVAIASLLPDRRVSERMAQACEDRLASAGLGARVERIEDTASSGTGAALAVWTTGRGVPFGADRAGARRRSSEAIGRWVADRLLEDLASGGTVDRHLADMLVIFASLAAGTSRYTAPLVTPHLETNIHLVEQFGASTSLDGTQVSVRGTGRVPRAATKATPLSGSGAKEVCT